MRRISCTAEERRTNSFSRRTMLQGVSYKVPATATVRRDHCKSRGNLGSRLTISNTWGQESPPLNMLALSRYAYFYWSFQTKKFFLFNVQLRDGSDSFSSQTSSKQHTLHLELYGSFILVINQLDAQNFCFTITLFHALHVLSTMCSSSGGQNCIIQPLVSSHL
jgi:hypothetical protein